MWEISNSVQAIDFLRSVIFGIFICAYYGIFAALRKNGINSNIAVLFEDILFFVIISPLIFLFLLATTNGELRLYIGIGILVGFYIFKFTFYKLLVLVISKLLYLIRTVLDFLRKIFLKFSCFLNVFCSKIGKLLVFLKKAVNSLKKGLKKSH